MSSHYYKIGTCFSCQKCMFCFTDLITDLCECDINIKPSRVKTNSQQIYSRIYDPYNTSSNQKQLLQRHDRIYAYCCDFDTLFNLTFCSACHSQYKRIKNSEDAGTSDGDNDDDSNYGDDVSVSSKKSPSCLQLKAKVIVQVENSTTLPAKWFTFNADKFFIFYNQLADHISKCTDTNNDNIDKDNIKITYKVNGRGQEMALEDEDDYDAFINESKKLKKSSKDMVLYITLKSDIKKRKKKVKV